MKLLDSRVLLLGAGGLGRPPRCTSRRRASARSGIVDDDKVDASNLQRQVCTRPRASASRRSSRRGGRIASSIPTSRSMTYAVRLTSENVERSSPTAGT